MLSVEEHLADVLRAVSPLGTVALSTREALGRVAATDVTATVDLPVFDNSAMDGFAVRFDDVDGAAPDDPVSLTVIGDIPAGSAAEPTLRPGEAARIMTGSPVPQSSDTIVPFEDTIGGLVDSLGSISVTATPRSRGAHIRRAGEDRRIGDVIVSAGTTLGPLQLAAIAAAGVADVAVSRAPRVAVVSTGSELVEPGQPLTRGQIPESNGTLLTTLCHAENADVVHTATVPDVEHDFLALLADIMENRPDVIVFTGGVSAGAYEVVRQSLTGTMSFRAVAMQPGKPQGFGVTENGTLLFGLPGNPVSAAVSFEVLVRPALRKMQGATSLYRDSVRLPAMTGWRTPPNRRQYLPVRIQRDDPSGWSVAPATSGGSHLAGGLASAEAYAVVDADVEAIHAGDTVDVIILPAY